MKNLIKKIITNQAEETKRAAKNFTKNLTNGTIIGLIGELGSGKTIFAQGIAEGLKIKGPITSPSFPIINIYQTTKMNLFHFDLYRINSIEELENIGYEEYFYGNGITVIEWADKCLEILPENSYLVYFKYLDKKKREIKIYKK